MPPSEQPIDDLVAAILDGTPVDWTAAASTSDATPPLLRQLEVLAAVAAFQRGVAREKLPLGPVPPARPVSDIEETPVLWGHLRVLDRIGAGSFGEVYRAWDARLDREVALKLLPSELRQDDREASAIIQEGRLLARVRHPNVATIYGAAQISDRIGLWMEFVRGQTLEQILDQGKVSVNDAIVIGVELCRAVSAVHGAGVIHRDIKTHNVMRAEDGRIVLMDFGTGRDRADDASSDLVGTPLYLAPEVLEGGPATVQSDVYSLGVLLYRLLTGSYPVHARSVAEVRGAHDRGERIAVRRARSDVPRTLARVIERAIDVRPERRYQTADALMADLAALRLRPRNVRLAYAASVASAVILVTGLSWEMVGRRAGSSRMPTALLMRFAALSPAGAVNVSPAERPIIAVLPLKNLSAEPESDHFVDGLTAEIIRNLALIDGLEVRSLTSSFAFKDKPRNLQEVGAQLGANLVVEGAVLRSGQRLRINVQLVQIAGEVPLWAEPFDRELKDVLAIQDEISQAVVNKLRLTLGRGRRHYETNLHAYELYLQTRALVDRRGFFDGRRAAELFEQVIARDSAFAPAYAGVADAYASMSLDIQGPHIPALPFESALSVMRPMALRALELDPMLAEAHAAIANVYSRERDWRNAQKSFEHAMDLNPGLTGIAANYSISTLIPLGKLNEAEQILRKALTRDPLSLSLQRTLAVVHRNAGRYDEAVHSLERIRTVDPNYPYVDIELARALTFAGRPVEALRILEPRSTQPGVQHWMARAYVLAGQRAAVERLAATHDHPFRLAVIYAAMGDNDRALEALDRAADSVPHRVAVLLRDPEMATLRDDSRFVGIRQKLGLP